MLNVVLVSIKKINFKNKSFQQEDKIKNIFKILAKSKTIC